MTRSFVLTNHADILSALGGIHKRQLSRYKALLKLSDEALELADRHNIEEGLLRHIINLPLEEQAEVVLHIINFGLTAKQVIDLCNAGNVEQSTQEEPLPRHTLQLVKLMKSVRSSTPEVLARALLEQEKDIEIARARLQSLRKLLNETEQYLPKG